MSRTHDARRRTLLAVIRALLLVLVAGLLPLLGTSSTSTSADGGTSDAASRVASGADLRLVARTRGPAADMAQLRRELRTSLRRADRGRGIPPRTQPRLQKLRQNKWNGPARCTADPGETTADICALGDLDGDRTVVLLGDSHLNMWIRGIQRPAREAGIRLLPIIKFGCPPYELRMWRFDLGPWEECFTWREWAHEQIEQIRPDVVVTSGHRNFTMSRDGETTPMPEDERDQAFLDGVSETIERLQDSAGRVVVLGDINYLKEDPVKCLKRKRASMRRCESPVTADTRHHNEILATAVAQAPSRLFDPPVDFHDPNDLICLRGRCPILANLTYMYFDFFHVSRTWSKHVGPLLAPQIGIAPREPGGLLS
ncbi:hypothetical protein KLP28_16270 [Nocardioidaceae bacterium]|nr:hypothetical protein KLP28_16270 [Nocardioidaceae bacterium]